LGRARRRHEREWKLEGLVSGGAGQAHDAAEAADIDTSILNRAAHGVLDAPDGREAHVRAAGRFRAADSEYYADSKSSPPSRL
jgi:hypothetical protein